MTRRLRSGRPFESEFITDDAFRDDGPLPQIPYSGDPFSSGGSVSVVERQSKESSGLGELCSLSL